MYRTYTGGEAPPITTIQNTQAPPEFLTLPQVIPTVGTSCLTILLVNTLSLAVCFPSLSPSVDVVFGFEFDSDPYPV